MSPRTLASVRPRQSRSSRTRLLIRSDARPSTAPSRAGTAATRLAADFFATFVDFFDLLFVIARSLQVSQRFPYEAASAVRVYLDAVMDAAIPRDREPMSRQRRGDGLADFQH